MTETLFEKSSLQNKAYSLPKEEDVFKKFLPAQNLLRQEPLLLPELSELDLIRHFSHLSHQNMSIDTNFYPLGSCTMKLNPKVNDVAANLKGYTHTHPLATDEMVQGNLSLIYELIEKLCDILGMSGGTLHPAAGAQGEYVGIRMIQEYHKSFKDFEREEILIPDSAHGTNAATSHMAGFKTITLKTTTDGHVDINELKAKLTSKTAALMLTNPTTLGLFCSDILKISELVHASGALMYLDGANMNALLNMVRPGDMGFDVMHLNLHKTFSTPHGGGGPGSGPVFCNELLKPFLPLPKVEKNHEGKFKIILSHPKSIGRIAFFHGNFSVYLRAYLYILLHGGYGLRKIAEQAILNANYLKHHLSKKFKIPFQENCLHEFVIQTDTFLEKDIKALDIAKRLLDYKIHAPTIYFPLIVKECLLIEPTESESKKTLDHFIKVMEKIVEEIEQNPELLKTAPHTLPVKRLDEVKAAKTPILKQNVKN